MPQEHYRGHTPRMSRLLAFIEQPEVIHLPVPGTCLRAETHSQAADREDPHQPRPVAHACAKPACISCCVVPADLHSFAVR